MDEEKKSMCIHSPQLEDVPVELIHRIQSLLPVNEAARTCVLSKSWLHAWSTIPTLKFPQSKMMVSEEEDLKYMKLFDSTLQRYLQNSIPIKPFDLRLDIEKNKSSPLTENWIQSIVSKSFFKKLYLTFCVKTDSFSLTDKIFASKNLHIIIIRVVGFHMDSVWTRSNPVNIMSNSVINCMYLRVLELFDVDISDEVLDRILSTCSLLEKIDLKLCEGLKTFKVINLRYLSELLIQSFEKDNTLEINDVPSLHLFNYHSYYTKPLPSNMDSLRSLTELYLDGVIIDNEVLDMISSKLPLLVTLNLHISDWGVETLNIKSTSLKRLILRISGNKQTEIQVYAPTLLYFCFRGETAPKLLFPTINSPETIDLQLYLWDPIDHSVLERIRKALNFSSKFDIKIFYMKPNIIVPVDVDDLKIRVPFSAANVHQLSFASLTDDCGEEKGLFLDSFFSICHPKYLEGYHLGCKENTFCKIMELMVSGLKENNTSDLKDVKIRNPHNGEWETLTNSWRSIMDGSADRHSIKFKLNWCS